MRKHLGEHAATAVADDRDAGAALTVHGKQGVEQRPQHHLRVPDVEGHARESGPVTHPFQPVELRAQRPVAGKKAGDEKHGAAQA